MRLLSLLVTASVACLAVLLSALPACEETLDVCPSCGDIMAGDVTIVREHRIDRTFDTVQRIRRRVSQAEVRFEAAVRRIGAVLEVDASIGVDGVAEAIAALLLLDTDTPIPADVRLPDCTVDRQIAMDENYRCEVEVCDIEEQTETALCSGLFSGSCDSPGEGICFAKNDKPCLGDCVGRCADAGVNECPGICIGNCEGDCAAFAPDGTCAGRCFGECSGQCESNEPFACSGGRCDGLCETDAGPEGCERFRGECPVETTRGDCLGHLYATGSVDEGGSRCKDGFGDCRETAKYLAWAALACDDGAVEFNHHVAEDGVERLTKLRLVARELSRILADYAWLSILVDGRDIKHGDLTGMFGPNEESILDDAMFDYLNGENGTDSPAAPERATYPLESFKARVYWMKQKAMNAGGGYRIFAGVFECMEPAMDDTLQLLEWMIPTRKAIVDEEEVWVPDTDCETVSADDDPDRPPCLYDLLSRQSTILAPILPSS